MMANSFLSSLSIVLSAYKAHGWPAHSRSGVFCLLHKGWTDIPKLLGVTLVWLECKSAATPAFCT